MDEEPLTVETLPNCIVTLSILPFITCDDWLSLRLASRNCYEIVHGNTDVSHACCPTCERRFPQRPSKSQSQSASENDSSESLWRLALRRDFQFDVSSTGENKKYQCIHCPPSDDSSQSFLSTTNLFATTNSFISWKHWRKIDRRIHSGRVADNKFIHPNERVVGPYFLRAAKLWKKIEEWCDDVSVSGERGREIKASLRPGVRLDPKSWFSNVIDHPTFLFDANLSALKAVYSFYAGQTTSRGYSASRNDLFGGYSGYGYAKITCWKEPLFTQNSIDFIIASNSCVSSRKTISMSLDSGQVYVCHGIDKRNATPESISCSDGDSNRAARLNPADSILRWFDEYADRLRNRFFSVFHTANDTTTSSRAVTRGVEVVASSIYSPDCDKFVYLICMRMLTPQDGEEYSSPDCRGFGTCQLVSRHWKVYKSSNAGETEITEGNCDGVAGEYPLLFEGGYRSHFSEGSSSLENYQIINFTNKYSMSMEGHLTFVPGSLNDPKGDTFNVRVAPFPFIINNPDFLY